MQVYVILKIWKGLPEEGGPEVFASEKAADARLIELVNEKYADANVKTIKAAIDECRDRREAGDDDELFYFGPLGVEGMKQAKKVAKQKAVKRRR